MLLFSNQLTTDGIGQQQLTSNQQVGGSSPPGIASCTPRTADCYQLIFGEQRVIFVARNINQLTCHSLFLPADYTSANLH